MADGNTKDEMIMTFHGPAEDSGAPFDGNKRDKLSENCVKVWHKEKCLKTASMHTVLAAVPDVVDARYFTIYFKDGASPWTYFCSNGESRSSLCL